MKNLLSIIISLVVICGVLAGCSTGVVDNNSASKKTAVVLDCDPGLDDSIAMFIMAKKIKSPDFIIATFGNNTGENVYKNAVILKKDLGLTAQIVKGKDNPLNSVKTEYSDFHGTDGLGETADELYEKLGVTDEEMNDFIDLDTFAQTIKQYDEVTYISVGPLTTLATLIEDEDVKSRLTNVNIMGGGIKTFNTAHKTEFNFSGDALAVNKVFDSGLNITLFPLDITNTDSVISSSKIDELEKIGTYPEFISLLRFKCKSHMKYESLDAAVIHDSLPVIYTAYSDSFTISDQKLKSNKWGHIYEANDGEIVHVATDLKEDTVWNLLKESFETK